MKKLVFAASALLFLCLAGSTLAQEMPVPSAPPSDISSAPATPPLPSESTGEEQSSSTGFKKPQPEVSEPSSMEAAQKLFTDHPSALIALALVLLGPVALWLILRKPETASGGAPVQFYDASMQQTMVSRGEPAAKVNSGIGAAGAGLALISGLLTAYLLSAKLPPVRDALSKILSANALAFGIAGWFAGREKFRLLAGSSAMTAGNAALGAYLGANLGLLIGALLATLLAGDIFVTALTTGLSCAAGLAMGADCFRLFAGKGAILALLTGKSAPKVAAQSPRGVSTAPVKKMDVERFAPPPAQKKEDHSRYAPPELREETPVRKDVPAPAQELVMERFGESSHVIDEKPKTQDTARPPKKEIVIERFDAGFIKPEDLPKPAPKAPTKPDLISLAKVTVNNVKLDLPGKKEEPDTNDDIPQIKVRTAPSEGRRPTPPPAPPVSAQKKTEIPDEVERLAEQTFSETKPEPFTPKAAPKEERLDIPEEKEEQVIPAPETPPAPRSVEEEKKADGIAPASQQASADFQPIREGDQPSTPVPDKELTGHKARVSALAVSPDGKYLLSGGDDNTLRVWDIKVGTRLHKAECGAFITAAAWSHDSSAFAFATTAKNISVRSSGDWAEKFPLAGHAQPARCAAFSPDGRFLASAGWDNTVKIWQLEGDEHPAIKTIEHHSDWISAALFSPDGKTFLSASYDCCAVFWNTDDWGMARQYDARASIYAGAFSPDGKMAALACEDRTIRLISVETAELSDSLKGLPAAAVSLSFSPDGKWLACGCKNGCGALWSMEKKALAALFNAGSGGAKICVFAADSLSLCAGGDDGLLRIFSVSSLLDRTTPRRPAESEAAKAHDSSARRRSPIEENYRADVKKTPVPQMTPRPKREEEASPKEEKPHPAEISSHTDKVVAGKYRILREIGRGGMSVVYEAYETALDRKVALKKLRKEIRDNPSDRERFLDEARLTARLKHHNIVDIYTILEGEDIFLVLEYVEGRTLSAVLDKYTKLPLKDSLAISKHILRALDYAHRHNVVHRDLKPANIMIANDGFVRVMDFGIAGLMLSKGVSEDRSGTMAYMAPEQENGQSDRRSDIFSFGATLYEMLTGELPFPGPNFTAQKQRRGFPPARELNRKVSSRLDRLITTCLDPEPERRYQNAGDILSEIRLIQAGQ